MSATTAPPRRRLPAANRVDPTGTKTIREQYARQLRKRYRALIRQTVRVIREDEALRLADFATLQEEPPDTRPTPTVPPPSPSYTFPTRDPADTLRKFIEWFENAADTYARASEQPGDWTDEYIRYVWTKGIDFAKRNLQTAGIPIPEVDIFDIFALPLHQQDASIFYGRQFQLLNGVNRAMSDELGRILTESFIEGVGPREAARRVNTALPNIAIPRANTIARTELVHAYNEAALNEYERALGPDGEVSALVEFLTAGDERVCPECEALEGEVFRIGDVHNMIPVHPLCRCTWVPLG